MVEAIATEQAGHGDGAADDQHELVRRLVSVADPAFRDDLAREAWAALRIRV